MENRVDNDRDSQKADIKGEIDTNKRSITIPELEEMVGPPIPWDEIEPIVKKYYKRFAKARKLNDFVRWLNGKYGTEITKDALGKRAARILEDDE